MLAQQALDAATVAGRVADPSGAPAAGALVTLRDTDRNRVRDVHADGRGRFVFLYVPPGRYSLIAVASGFDSQTISFPLSIGQTLDVPITLLIPGVAATVSVSGEPPLVEAGRTQVADTITPRRDRLAAAERPQLPRPRAAGAQRVAHEHAQQRAVRRNIGGARHRHLGGRPAQHRQHVHRGRPVGERRCRRSGRARTTAEEVIREFQVVTSGGTAEFGRASAGVINIVTQSGTNQPRGARATGSSATMCSTRRIRWPRQEDPLSQSQYGADLWRADRAGPDVLVRQRRAHRPEHDRRHHRDAGQTSTRSTPCSTGRDPRPADWPPATSHRLRARPTCSCASIMSCRGASRLAAPLQLLRRRERERPQRRRPERGQPRHAARQRDHTAAVKLV